MKKVRYLTYDFQMQDLVKLVFEKKGKILVPAFEHGRILVRETHNTEQSTKLAGLFLLKRPQDEEQQASHILGEGGDWQLHQESYGAMTLDWSLLDLDIASFGVFIKSSEQCKGYGTVLMNAGAKHGRSVGVKSFKGTQLLDGDNYRREKFYKDLGMPKGDFGKHNVCAEVNNPKLNQIKLTENESAQEIWNELAKAKGV